MDGDGGPNLPPSMTQGPESQETTQETNIQTSESQESGLVNAFLQSKDFLNKEIGSTVLQLKDEIVKEITANVISEVNKKLEENNRIAESSYVKKDPEVEWVEKQIAEAMKLKVTY